MRTAIGLAIWAAALSGCATPTGAPLWNAARQSVSISLQVAGHSDRPDASGLSARRASADAPPVPPAFDPHRAPLPSAATLTATTANTGAKPGTGGITLDFGPAEPVAGSHQGSKADRRVAYTAKDIVWLRVAVWSEGAWVFDNFLSFKDLLTARNVPPGWAYIFLVAYDARGNIIVANAEGYVYGLAFVNNAQSTKVGMTLPLL
jgi:hypothetical protein